MLIAGLAGRRRLICGDQVQHNDSTYKANWWPRNQNPEQYADQYPEWSLSARGAASDGGDGGIIHNGIERHSRKLGNAPIFAPAPRGFFRF